MTDTATGAMTGVEAGAMTVAMTGAASDGNFEVQSAGAGMQLIVVPVTTRLLTQKNHVRNQIIPFAEEKHIPVLPLMMESGLGEMFRRQFGKKTAPRRRN